MLELIKNHPRVICFSLITFIFSILGQSYFLAFFNHHIEIDLKIDAKELSSIYSVGTMFAAICLPFMGSLIDKGKIFKVLLGVVVGLSCGYLLLAHSNHSLLVLFSFFIIRLTGQSSLGLIPATVLGRSFGNRRGRALSIMSVGKLIGDGVMPAFGVFLISYLGWRDALVSLTGIFAVVVTLSAYFLLKNYDEKEVFYPEKTRSPEHTSRMNMALRDIFKDKKIYLAIFFGTLIPFIMTGLFFHQQALLEFKNWTPKYFAAMFLWYSIFQFLVNILMGQLIDKVGATRLFPYNLIFFCISLVALLVFHGKSSGIFFMGFCGIAVGASHIVRMAFWAENYGTATLGRIKSVDSSVMVFSTAAAPVLFAYLIDYFASFKLVLVLMAFISLLGAFGSFIMIRYYKHSE